MLNTKNRKTRIEKAIFLLKKKYWSDTIKQKVSDGEHFLFVLVHPPKVGSVFVVWAFYLCKGKKIFVMLLL